MNNEIDITQELLQSSYIDKKWKKDRCLREILMEKAGAIWIEHRLIQHLAIAMHKQMHSLKNTIY